MVKEEHKKNLFNKKMWIIINTALRNLFGDQKDKQDFNEKSDIYNIRCGDYSKVYRTTTTTDDKCYQN